VLTAGALALWAALDHLLLPPLRFFLRRRVERVLAELDTRLRIRIQPFKLTRRRALIDRLLFDRQVVAAAEEEALRRGLRRAQVLAEAERYAREIVPAFNAYIYFRLGYWLARRLARFLYRVRLGWTDEAALAALDPSATVVFVMNHRSNVDYILVAYLAAERTALSYAVGEWARIWPLDNLFRSMGAYFVRRNSQNPLYRKVLERYVATATAEGVTQAVFPEGGLSRDGRLRPPKLGLFDYMLRAFDPAGERDLVFVPVGINYDRTLEDRTLLLEVAPEAKAKRAQSAIGGTAAFIGRNLALMLRQEWHRFGYACVNFGTPLSLRAWLDERGLDLRRLEKSERAPHVEALGEELMARVGRVVPVVPVALVATLFVTTPAEALSLLELKARAFALWRELEQAGAHVYVPRRDQDYSIEVGLRMLTQRRLVEEIDGLYRPRSEELHLLAYYAGSIAHLRADPA